MRDRMMAVIKGHQLDRIPFVSYNDNAAPNEEIWTTIGRENMGILRGTAIHKLQHPNCRFESVDITKNGLRGQQTTLITPKGNLTEEKFFQPTYDSPSISKHFIKDLEDYEIFLSFLKDITVVEHLDYFRHHDKAVGDDGICLVAVDRTPYQQLWIQWVSILDLSIHLYDCPEIVEECIVIMTKLLRQQFKIVMKAIDILPIPLVEFPDNITAPVIGEHYFRKYALPLYNEFGSMLAEKKIPLGVHMDGDIKPLWSAIGESKLSFIESFSPKPDNDTSALEVTSMWPNMKLFLNFPSSIHLAEPEVIYQKTMEILNEAGHTKNMWIQVSESVPPGVWKKSFPPIIKAINDFGRP